MKRKKVYNLFQINLILFNSFSILLVPILVVFAYIFDLHLVTSANRIILVADIIAALTFIVGLTFILITRDHFQRRLKPSYSKEFLWLIIISAFGILGIGILFIYLGGKEIYVPHIIIPLFLITYLLLYAVGQKYFNINLLKR
ncbi:MAG: hypothetical protein KQ78_01343 [Candidatus Izimaplasma bacterium HR2]|nr:MAG: hypothetical protein KQ78_01343 [Candidatus Izimaplasma bacterium HR2]